MFGGEKSWNRLMRIRECLNDTRIYDIYTSEWKYLRCTGEMIEPRRNHAAVIINKTLIIYGGIDNHGHYLKDVWELNLINGK